MQMLPVGNSRRAGVTLLEMLIVVSIIAAIVSVSFPSLTSGLAGIRLTSAAGSVASFLTTALNNVDRREQAAAIVISPADNTLAIYTAASGDKPTKKLEMPTGIAIEADELKRFLLFPGGACPRIVVILRNEKGSKRSIQIDPITAVPKIQRVAERALMGLRPVRQALGLSIFGNTDRRKRPMPLTLHGEVRWWTWRTHSCVPRRHSCRRPALLQQKVSRESRHGTQECVRHGRGHKVSGIGWKRLSHLGART